MKHGWNDPRQEGLPGHYTNEPDTSRKAHALVRLTFNPAGASYVFEPGDELQDILPADVLAACIANGEAAWEGPGSGER